METKNGTVPVAGMALTLALALVVTPARAADKDSPWKARSEMSFVRTGGNSDTQTFAGLGAISLSLTPNRYFLTATGLYSEDDNETSASRWRVGARYERALTQRLFAFAEANYLKDTFAGFDSKIELGPGLGYDIIKTKTHLLLGRASVLQTWDNTTDDKDDSYVTGKAILDYTWQILENLKFNQYLDYLVSFEDTNVYFMNSESKVEARLNSHISLATGYVVNYQNDPPDDTDETDTRFFTSLIVDY
jgi:putative salt-induced outer membrane protein